MGIGQMSKDYSAIMAEFDGMNFDLGYKKGFDAGVKWAQEQIAKESTDD
jgi:hypothetical protein